MAQSLSALAEPGRRGQDRAMITGLQIRGARALLRWSTKDLADHAKLGIATIHRAEATDDVPSMNVHTLIKLRSTLEDAGVTFLDAGVNRDGGAGVRLTQTN